MINDLDSLADHLRDTAFKINESWDTQDDLKAAALFEMSLTVMDWIREIRERGENDII